MDTLGLGGSWGGAGEDPCTWPHSLWPFPDQVTTHHGLTQVLWGKNRERRPSPAPGGGRRREQEGTPDHLLGHSLAPGVLGLCSQFSVRTAATGLPYLSLPSQPSSLGCQRDPAGLSRVPFPSESHSGASSGSCPPHPHLTLLP